jgi:hypothetical protein
MPEPRRRAASCVALLVLNVAALEVPTPPHQSTLSIQLPQAARALHSPVPDPPGTSFPYRHKQSALTVTTDNVGSSTSAYLAADSATSARIGHACATSASAPPTGTIPVDTPFTVNTTVLRSSTEQGTPPLVCTTTGPTPRHQAGVSTSPPQRTTLSVAAPPPVHLASSADATSASATSATAPAPPHCNQSLPPRRCRRPLLQRTRRC